MRGWKELSRLKKACLIFGTIVVLGAIGGSDSSSKLSNSAKDNSTASQLSVEQKQPIDVVEIKTESKTESIPFESTTQNDATLSSGSSKVSVPGVNGERTITYEVTYKNGVETERVEKSNEVTKQPVTQVTSIGTKVASQSSNCDPNYSPCIPYVSYDLDCADIGRSVVVTGYDHHRFDRDGDGYGCESY